MKISITVTTIGATKMGPTPACRRRRPRRQVTVTTVTTVLAVRTTTRMLTMTRTGVAPARPGFAGTTTEITDDRTAA